MTEENLGLTAEGLVMIGSEDMPAGTPIVKGSVNQFVDTSSRFCRKPTASIM